MKKNPSDGQQFHQNKQNKQRSLTLTHRTQKKDIDVWHWKYRTWLGTGTKKCAFICSTKWNKICSFRTPKYFHIFNEIFG